MSEIHIRIEGCAGRITLDRPHALNAVTYEQVIAIEKALDAWRDDPAVALVIIDATGDKAFSAGGDLAEMYRTGSAGDYTYGRKFWSDEYRLNAKIANYSKPYVAFMQGFTMGGGVGVSCHGSHRIVCENSKISMPECAVGLVPDVGGSAILAAAPGHLGEFLGVSGFRMGPGDAIFAGFADHFVPRDGWPELIAKLADTGEADIPQHTAPARALDAEKLKTIDDIWSRDTLADIADASDENTLSMLAASSPLSMACAVELVRRVRGKSIEDALTQEYRFTARAMEHGDFIEGIRAVIVEKDRNPNWRFAKIADVTQDAVEAMLAPLEEELKLM